MANDQFRVLVIDDDPSVRDYIELFLERTYFRDLRPRRRQKPARLALHGLGQPPVDVLQNKFAVLLGLGRLEFRQHRRTWPGTDRRGVHG